MKAAWMLASAVCALALWSPDAEAACTPPACNKIIDNGPDSGKKVLVVMGDGYAAADQTKWREDVERMITSGVFGKDVFAEDQNAFNVYRLDLVSTDSGVTRRVYDEHGTPTNASDDTIVSTTYKNTALGYIYSGSWAHCWMEYGTNTGTLINNALSTHVPNYNYWVILLNEDGWGGCGGGGAQIITRGGDWSVVAHEFGHGIGALWDEYFNAGTTYTGGPVDGPNCSTNLNRSTVYWNRFIAPATAVPTTFLAGMDSNRTVGMFQGCGTVASGIYRPVENCRMRGNSPQFCPVCRTRMKGTLYTNAAHNFNRAFAGDFSGDGRADVLIHNGQDLAMYKTNPTGRTLDDNGWIVNNVVPGGWQPAANDQYVVADFDNDGRKDLYVFNGTDWSMPYLGMIRSTGAGFQLVARYDGSIPGFWSMANGDKIYAGDWDGDGRADLAIHNGTNWSMTYLGLLRSTGTSLSGLTRHDGTVPGWSMAGHDQLFPGDFDADGRTDLYVFNPDNWSTPYVGMLRSNGTALSATAVYAGTLPGWTMTASDQFFVGDFDLDGRRDLYVFNGAAWAYAYLLMARSTGTGLAYVRQYNSSSAAANIPGWEMRKNDRFFLTDANQDGRADLFAFNPALDWSTEYLATLTSSGTALGGSWSADWVGNWNLGVVDQIIAADYDGDPGTAGLFIRNAEWMGLIRKAPAGFTLDRIYRKWIYTPPYDARPWSDTLP